MGRRETTAQRAERKARNGARRRDRVDRERDARRTAALAVQAAREERLREEHERLLASIAGMAPGDGGFRYVGLALKHPRKDEEVYRGMVRQAVAAAAAGSEGAPPAERAALMVEAAAELQQAWATAGRVLPVPVRPREMPRARAYPDGRIVVLRSGDPDACALAAALAPRGRQ